MHINPSISNTHINNCDNNINFSETFIHMHHVTMDNLAPDII
jgi:hypothetical protein